MIYSDENSNYEFFDGDQEYFEYSPTLNDYNSFEDDFEDEDYYFDGDGYDDEEITYEDIFSDLDFSAYSGDVRSNLKRTIQKVESRKPVLTDKIRNISIPEDRTVIVEGKGKRPAPISSPRKVAQEIRRQVRKPVNGKPRRRKFVDKGIGVKKKAEIIAARKGVGRVIVPDDRKVIVEGVNSFILDQRPEADFVKNLGYRDGKKLRELIVTFNNDSAIDFEIELFNPSMPLDFLHSTSLNINDKVLIAGGTTSYTDVLYNLLANPARIYASKFVVAGAKKLDQINQPLLIKNKNIAGEQKIEPFQMQLNVDIDQNQNDILYFDLEQTLNRPFIPDGMDIIKYKVLAGMTVTFGFYYSQVSLKKFFYPEAQASKTLL